MPEFGPYSMPTSVGTHGDLDIAEMAQLLKGRKAQCAHCGSTADSMKLFEGSLPFFEYRGEGSAWAVDHCANCFYVSKPHNPNDQYYDKRTAHEFVPRGPAEFDSFYDGCRGWD